VNKRVAGLYRGKNAILYEVKPINDGDQDHQESYLYASPIMEEY
jgi:hypothetical protein